MVKVSDKDLGGLGSNPALLQKMLVEYGPVILHGLSDGAFGPVLWGPQVTQVRLIQEDTYGWWSQITSVEEKLKM